MILKTFDNKLATGTTLYGKRYVCMSCDKHFVLDIFVVYDKNKISISTISLFYHTIS